MAFWGSEHVGAVLHRRGSVVTAQPDSVANGSRHPRRHGSERYATGQGEYRTVKDD